VLRSGHHLLALINNVLDLTRLDGGQFPLEPLTVDAWASLQQSLTLVQPLASELGIVLPTLSLAAREPCWVHADPAALEQVRTMMRAVVTEGTATRLNGLGEVRGKTGTAEFTGDGNRAHGWFVGYRGDLAFAVLVVDGGSSEPAVAAAGRFLAAVPS
jgi:hypothetical protein